MSTSIDHGEHMVNIAVHYGCKVQLSVCLSGWWGCWFGKAMLPTCIWLFVCLFDYLCVFVFSVCLARMSLEMLVWASNCCLFWQWLCVWLSVFLLVCVSGEDEHWAQRCWLETNCRPLCLWLSGRPGVRSYLEVAARPPLIMIQYTPSPPWLHAANTNKRTNGAATFNSERWATFPLELVIREVLEHNYSSCIHSLQNLKN